MTDHEWWMDRTIAEAWAATASGNAPAAALIVRGDEIIAIGHNTKTTDRSGFAHAELNALLKARPVLDRHPEGVTIYSTLEPCAMCLGAIIFAGIRTVVFGAYERDTGAVELLRGHPVYGKWMPKVIGGVRETQCEELKRVPLFTKAPPSLGEQPHAFQNPM